MFSLFTLLLVLWWWSDCWIVWFCFQVFNRFGIQPPRGVLFHGPPGTGKTLVARALANECGQSANGQQRVAFFMRKGADCLSKWVGESERQLRLLFDQVGCCLLRKCSVSCFELSNHSGPDPAGSYAFKVERERFFFCQMQRPLCQALKSFTGEGFR